MKNCNDDDEDDEYDDPLDGFDTARELDEQLQAMRKMIHGRGRGAALRTLTMCQAVLRLAVEGANAPSWDAYDKLESFLR